MAQLRVVVADDDEAVRLALVDVLGSDPRFAVVGSVATGPEAVAAAETTQPDVVLLDVRMPGGGLQAARRLAGTSGRPAVVAVSASTDVATIVAMVRAGAVGYLAKGRLGQGLPDVVARCANGQVVLAVPNGTAVLRALTGSFSEEVPAT